MQGLLGAPWDLVARGREALYRHGLLDTHRLGRPTISIGALEMGGTGKTPAVAAVAHLLQRAGRKPAVISRGYARDGRRPSVVNAGSGLCVDVRSAGDEPTWFARALDEVPVAVAAQREQAAALLEQRSVDADVYLLDDAYQHVRVARDVNLLVVDAEQPFWEQAPPPCGRLREGAAAAARASAFMVVSASETGRAVCRQLDRRYPGRPAFALLRDDPGYWPLGSWDPRAQPAPANELDAAYVAFAGIARPQRFFDGLQAAGIALHGTRTFRDHHWYTDDDLARLQTAATTAGAAALLTTEKDAVRLPHQEAPADVPIFVWSYRLRLERPAEFEAWLLSRIGPSAGRCP